MCKCEDCHHTGDCWHERVKYGIFHNQMIEIPIDDIPEEIRLDMEEYSMNEIKSIITRALLQIAENGIPSSLVRKAVAAGRLRWTLT